MLTIKQKSYLSYLLLAIFVAAAVYRAYVLSHPFAPELNAYGMHFSADDAVGVMISNDDAPFDAMRIYFFGMDRYGAWPFYLPRLIHQTLGYNWSVTEVFMFGFVFGVLGFIPLAYLSGKYWYEAVVFSLLALSLSPLFGRDFFAICAPLHWQIPTLLASWAGLRYTRELRDRSAGWWRIVINGTLAAICAFLAIWSSLLSCVFLLVIVATEFCTDLLTANKQTSRKKMLFSGGAVAVVAVLTIGERAMNQMFREHVPQQFKNWFYSKTQIDHGFILDNIKNLTRVLQEAGYLGPVLIPILILCGTCIFWFLTRSKKPNHATNLASAMVPLGLFWIAAANYLVAAVVMHVRHNSFQFRYLVPSALGLTLAFGLSLAMGLTLLLQNRPNVLVSIRMALVGLLTIFVIYQTPDFKISNTAIAMQNSANALAQAKPGTIIFGGYWSAYPWAGLAPEGKFRVVTDSWDANRAPWFINDMTSASEFVLTDYILPLHAGWGSASTYIYTHKTLWQLQQLTFIKSDYPFHLYKNISSKIASVKLALAPGDPSDSCNFPEQLRVEFAPRRNGTAIIPMRDPSRVSKGVAVVAWTKSGKKVSLTTRQDFRSLIAELPLLQQKDAYVAVEVLSAPAPSNICGINAIIVIEQEVTER